MRTESRKQRVIGAVAIGVGIVAATVFVAALIFAGVHIWASLRPVTEADVVGAWVSEEDPSESLVLHSDGTAAAVDLQSRGMEVGSGTGRWSLVGGAVLLVIDDGRNTPGAEFLAERSGFTLLLADYIGHPDEGERRFLMRDDG